MRVASMFLSVAFVLAVFGVAAEAENTASSGAQHRLNVHGFLLGTVAGRTTGVRPAGGDGSDFVLVEERLRFDLGAATSSGAAILLVKGDLFHEAGANRSDVDLREASIGYTAGALDVRLGRQIVTWGVGDLVFINDVFPKDWESYFSGRPLEYLKLGVDGLRAIYSSAAVSGDLIVIPFFTPDAFPSAARFFFYDPFSAVLNQQESPPAALYSNTEFALRTYGRLAGFDASLYAYRGFWRTPSARVENLDTLAAVTRFYPELSEYGASVQRNLLMGVVSLETGYYDSREDREGTDPVVPNSQWRFLAGYQRLLDDDLTAGLQAYAELMVRHDAYRGTLPAGSPAADRIRWVFTSRVTKLLDYQTWKLTIFIAYSPSDQDFFFQPEISHRLSDEFGVSLGANLFGGKDETTFFGQFDRSDNVYLSARFDY